jgi:hypothetical protein
LKRKSRDVSDPIEFIKIKPFSVRDEGVLKGVGGKRRITEEDYSLFRQCLRYCPV